MRSAVWLNVSMEVSSSLSLYQLCQKYNLIPIIYSLNTLSLILISSVYAIVRFPVSGCPSIILAGIVFGCVYIFGICDSCVL